MYRTQFDPEEIPADIREFFEEIEVQCGAPWKRITERSGETRRQKGARVGFNGYADANPGNPQGLNHSGHRGPIERETLTIGWEPSCRCDAGDPIPQTVLDIFAGSGTTLLVADRLGRDAIGIELNGSYTTMIEQRLRDDGPLFLDMQTEAPAPDRPTQAAMFTEEGGC